MMRTRTAVIGLTVLAMLAGPAVALDDVHHAAATKAIAKGLAYLRKNQQKDGSWSPNYGPAITGLVLSAMARQPEVDRKDPAISKAITYIIAHQKEDGGIYGKILPNYNTSISLMGLGQFASDKDIAPVVRKAQKFVIAQQWQEGMKDPKGITVTKDHPFFGGAGYGSHGRPDLNNTSVMLEGLHDSGLDCNDPAFKRALVFIQRCQGAPSNDKFGKDVIKQDGGFIYATSVDKDHIGLPQTRTDDAISKRDMAAGKVVSPLPTYGSITYAGMKSLLYAKVDPKDPRVQAVRAWVAANYVLDHNPGMSVGSKYQSHYYYLHTFSRAHHAAGDKLIKTKDGKQHDWANDLIETLVKLQKKDGSWVNDRAGRWAEADANLVTAYAVIALQHAIAGK